MTECCEPVVPGKTCSNQSVVCLHGYARIAGSYDDTAPTDCGNCEVNNLSCCAGKFFFDCQIWLTTKNWPFLLDET